MNIKNLIIGIAIFILTISVGVYGISTIYGKGPSYEIYCPQINNEKACNDFGANWTNYSTAQMNSIPPIPVTELKTAPIYGGGYCDNSQKCNLDFQVARENYNKKKAKFFTYKITRTDKIVKECFLMTVNEKIRIGFTKN